MEDDVAGDAVADVLRRARANVEACVAAQARCGALMRDIGDVYGELRAAAEGPSPRALALVEAAVESHAQDEGMPPAPSAARDELSRFARRLCLGRGGGGRDAAALIAKENALRDQLDGLLASSESHLEALRSDLAVLVSATRSLDAPPAPVDGGGSFWEACRDVAEAADAIARDLRMKHFAAASLNPASGASDVFAYDTLCTLQPFLAGSDRAIERALSIPQPNGR